MVPGTIQKFGHFAGVLVLYTQAQIETADVLAAVPDLLLGALFIVAFAKTRTLPWADG